MKQLKLAGLAILLSVVAGQATGQEKIKLGVIVTLSGPAAALGQQVRDFGIGRLVFVHRQEQPRGRGLPDHLGEPANQREMILVMPQDGDVDQPGPVAVIDQALLFGDGKQGGINPEFIEHRADAPFVEGVVLLFDRAGGRAHFEMRDVFCRDDDDFRGQVGRCVGDEGQLEPLGRE